MEADEPCSICGCTQKNLIDGFYYCEECGTQDVNVRETIVEYVTVGDGVLALGTKKRVTQIPQATEVQMTDNWYKWHGLNFLLRGLADELIEIGAAESVKTKLLWIWTRYMKKFQNKADFGLATNEESDDNQEDEKAESALNDDDNSSDEDEHINYSGVKASIPNIKTINMHLVISLLYVALNIDQSPIQLSDLFRFIKEERISVMSWQKLIPRELRPNKLKGCFLLDIQLHICSSESIRVLGMDLYRELDLGNPVVPDMRQLVDRYLKELCLPNGLKPLVSSLMHYRSFDYLDVNTQYGDVKRMPAYELNAIAHILMALKICFGLDSEYEAKLSDAIDKLNEIEEHPKSYNSEPTDRMFSFRDWVGYIQFRKTLLRSHTLYLGAPNYLDMNDYVTFEHLKERKDYEMKLKDEITYDIINKIPSGEVNVIPRSEFVATLTPHVTYTRVIMQHQQDKTVKELLSEDFTQYSVKYFMKDMFLIDPDSTNPKNILTGVNKHNIREHKTLFDCINPVNKFAKEMVYVKDCDNHNWTVTRRPQMEHVTKYGKNEHEDKEKDHGYVSNSEIHQNILNIDNNNLDSTQKSLREDSEMTNQDLSTITDIEMETEKNNPDDEAMKDDSSSSNIDTEVKTLDKDKAWLEIRVADANENIFDDDFVYLDPKIEEENEQDEMEPECSAPAEISEVLRERFQRHDLNEVLVDYWDREKDSDESSVESFQLNPQSLDRTEAIKELIMHACDKYKVSIPGKYICKPKRGDKPKQIKRPRNNKTKRSVDVGAKQKITDLITSYHSQLQHDVLNQMSCMVQSAIANFNNTKDEAEIPTGSEVIQPVDDDFNVDQNIEMEENRNQNPDDITEQSNHEDACEDYNLFGDSSDGEINAEDLLPKKNPEFDEKTHDISQLYIKPNENTSAPEITLNPKLFKIIDKAIEADTESETEPAQAQEKSDSEDELALSIHQELKRIRNQLTKQARQNKTRDFEFLLPCDNIPKYNYWIRHYIRRIIYNRECVQKFTNEIDANFPKSFVHVLKECADVVGYTPFLVYKSLQRVETCIKDKYVRNKVFDKKYCDSHKRFKKVYDF